MNVKTQEEIIDINILELYYHDRNMYNYLVQYFVVGFTDIESVFRFVLVMLFI